MEITGRAAAVQQVGKPAGPQLISRMEFMLETISNIKVAAPPQPRTVPTRSLATPSRCQAHTSMPETCLNVALISVCWVWSEQQAEAGREKP